jgi:hypothetical protein
MVQIPVGRGYESAGRKCVHTLQQVICKVGFSVAEILTQDEWLELDYNYIAYATTRHGVTVRTTKFGWPGPIMDEDEVISSS